MRGRAAVAVVGVLLATAAGCSTGGDSDDRDPHKRVLQGAAVSVAGGLVWVAGGAEGPADELFVGLLETWAPQRNVTAHDLDGNEVASVELDLAPDEAVVEAVVADVDGRSLLVGGTCGSFRVACAGPTRPFVAWLDLAAGTAEPVAVEVTGDGAAQLLGVGGGAAWVLLDPHAEARLLRLDGATGEAVASELPPFIFTGDVCVADDGLVAAVADLDDQFAVVGVELFVRPTGTGARVWTSAGVLSMDDRRAVGVQLHCLGDGAVVLDLRGDVGPLVVGVVGVDGATVVDEPPPELLGDQLAAAADPADGLAVAVAWRGGAASDVLAYRRDRGWRAIGSFRASASGVPVLAIVDGVVVEVGGMAVVAGGRPQRVGSAS